MEPMKRMTSKTPIPPSILVKTKTTKQKKKVRFTPSPEGQQGHKRQASSDSNQSSTAFAFKFARKELSTIPPRVRRIISQTLSKAATASANEPKTRTVSSTNVITRPAVTTSIDVFDLPKKPVYPFDKERDWFNSMHAYVSCKARPMHVIGVKSDNTRKQCEGVESLDDRLLRGEVSVVFHQDSEKEPACETCWTMEAHPELVQNKKSWGDALRIPGSWPAEEAEGLPHRHGYLVIYMGCKLRKDAENRITHALRIVKGIGIAGESTSLCRCKCASQLARSPGALRMLTIKRRANRTLIQDKDKQEILASPSRPTGGKDSSDIPNFEQKLYMPAFAGCPACDGKDLTTFVKRLDELGKKPKRNSETSG
ncbi:hypothetical protein TWF696_002989 [Orbilia brochopaga]|uniref:Uncharacterized protein n=1 Tax=Orbilia brochopaga TaxID=3140254 RepID=A0AAV9U1E8_9PEZI